MILQNIFKGLIISGTLRILNIINTNEDMLKVGGVIIMSDVVDTHVIKKIDFPFTKLNKSNINEQSPILRQSEDNFNNRPKAIFRPFGI